MSLKKGSGVREEGPAGEKKEGIKLSLNLNLNLVFSPRFRFANCDVLFERLR